MISRPVQSMANARRLIEIPPQIHLFGGARYITGENLKVVWAEFSTLSLAVLLNRNLSRQQKHSRFSTCKLGAGFVLLA